MAWYTYEHVFRALDRLEANKGDLHGQNSAKTVESAVGHIDASTKPPSHHQSEDVHGNQVDEENIATP
jgi:hypothetical protein